MDPRAMKQMMDAQMMLDPSTLEQMNDPQMMMDWGAIEQMMSSEATHPKVHAALAKLQKAQDSMSSTPRVSVLYLEDGREAKLVRQQGQDSRVCILDTDEELLAPRSSISTLVEVQGIELQVAQLREVGDHVMAAKALRGLLVKHPTWAHMHMKLGEVLDHGGEPACALTAYQRGLELNPSDNKGWANIVKVYVALQRYEEAVEAGLRSLELDPSDGIALHNLSVAYTHLGRFSEARECQGQIKQEKSVVFPKDCPLTASYRPKLPETRRSPQLALEWVEWGFVHLHHQKLHYAFQAFQQAALLQPVATGRFSELRVALFRPLPNTVAPVCCIVCNAMEAPKRCSQCKWARYCTVKCQQVLQHIGMPSADTAVQVHWPKHKNSCQLSADPLSDSYQLSGDACIKRLQAGVAWDTAIVISRLREALQDGFSVARNVALPSSVRGLESMIENLGPDPTHRALTAIADSLELPLALQRFFLTIPLDCRIRDMDICRRNDPKQVSRGSFWVNLEQQGRRGGSVLPEGCWELIDEYDEHNKLVEPAPDPEIELKEDHDGGGDLSHYRLAALVCPCLVRIVRESEQTGEEAMTRLLQIGSDAVERLSTGSIVANSITDLFNQYVPGSNDRVNQLMLANPYSVAAIAALDVEQECSHLWCYSMHFLWSLDNRGWEMQLRRVRESSWPENYTTTIQVLAAVVLFVVKPALEGAAKTGGEWDSKHKQLPVGFDACSLLQRVVSNTHPDEWKQFLQQCYRTEPFLMFLQYYQAVNRQRRKKKGTKSVIVSLAREWAEGDKLFHQEWEQQMEWFHKSEAERERLRGWDQTREDAARWHDRWLEMLQQEGVAPQELQDIDELVAMIEGSESQSKSSRKSRRKRSAKRNTTMRAQPKDVGANPEAEEDLQIFVASEECVICLDAPADTLLLHFDAKSAHQCCCYACARDNFLVKEVSKPDEPSGSNVSLSARDKPLCPMCRQPIDFVKRAP